MQYAVTWFYLPDVGGHVSNPQKGDQKNCQQNSFLVMIYESQEGVIGIMGLKILLG